jgi:hypothetical protein
MFSTIQENILFVNKEARDNNRLVTSGSVLEYMVSQLFSENGVSLTNY